MYALPLSSVVDVRNIDDASLLMAVGANYDFATKVAGYA